MSEQDDESTDLSSAIPTEVAQTVTKREEHEDLRDWDFEALRGHWVEINASGYRYRGRLEGADETDIYLRTVTRYLVLPLDHVGAVKPIAEPPEPPMKRKGPIPGDPDPSMDGDPVYPEDGEGSVEHEGAAQSEKGDEPSAEAGEGEAR